MTAGHSREIKNFYTSGSPQQGELKLMDFCREEIRSHLIEETGGNQKNLITAVPRLPLPDRLRKYLLYDLDISECIEMQGSTTRSNYFEILW